MGWVGWAEPITVCTGGGVLRVPERPQSSDGRGWRDLGGAAIGMTNQDASFPLQVKAAALLRLEIQVEDDQDEHTVVSLTNSSDRPL